MRQILTRRVATYTAALLGIGVYFAAAVSAAARKSGTFDEYVHVTAGYAYWKLNDYRLNPEAGNWPQRLEALPAVLSGASFPPVDQPAWAASDMWTLSDQMFFQYNDAESLLRPARMVVTVVASLLGLLVFLWARKLFGVAGAYVSLLLFVFDPAMLAHGGLATSDLVAAAFFTAATWALWTVLHRVTPGTILVGGVTLSGVFLSKLSAPAVAVTAIGMLAVRLWVGRPLEIRLGRSEHTIRSRGRQAAVLTAVALAHMVMVVAVIWASYGFRYSAMGSHSTPADQFIDPWSDVLEEQSVVSQVVSWGRSTRILPEAYLYAIASVSAYSRHRVAFMNGRVTTEGGWRSFFPYAALVKTTIPELLVLLIGLGTLAWDALSKRPGSGAAANGLYELVPIGLLIVVYGAFAVWSPLNIGHRHLLPIIPAAIVLAGASGRILQRRVEHAG
jgi:hypothetical protein